MKVEIVSNRVNSRVILLFLMGPFLIRYPFSEAVLIQSIS